MIKTNLTAQESCFHLAKKSRAQIGRDGVAKIKILLRRRPFGLGIENGEVRIVSHPDRSFAIAESR
jgi:hypothetical protein